MNQSNSKAGEEVGGKWQVWLVDEDGRKVRPESRVVTFAAAASFCRGYLARGLGKLLPVAFELRASQVEIEYTNLVEPCINFFTTINKELQAAGEDATR